MTLKALHLGTSVLLCRYILIWRRHYTLHTFQIFKHEANRCSAAAAAGCCYMYGPSRGPAVFQHPPPRNSQGSKLERRGNCEQRLRGPRGVALRGPRWRRTHLTHRRRLRGVCSTAPTPGAALAEGHPAGTSPDDFSGADLLRLAKKSAGDIARRIRAGSAGTQRGGREKTRGARAGVGAPSPPAPRSAAGQLCLRRRAMCCVSISPCPAAKPPGAAAALNPLGAAFFAPDAPGTDSCGRGRNPRSDRVGTGLSPPSRSLDPLETTTDKRGGAADSAAPFALRAL